MAALHPLPSIPGTVRCQASGALISGKKWSNVVHCKFTGAAGQPSAADLSALDLKLIRLWSGTIYTGGVSWLTNCPNATTLTNMNYYVLDGTSPAVNVSRNLSGAGGTSSAPSEVAFVLTLRTTKRGRRYRGRIFLPTVVPGSISASGQLSSILVGQFLSQFDGLVTDLATINWQIGVATYGYSIDKHGTVTNWPPDFTPVAAGIAGRSMDGVADVQRHRKG